MKKVSMREFIEGNGFKKVVGLEDYFINKSGEVYRIATSKSGKESLRSVSLSKTVTGALKFNTYENSKSKCYQVHNVVYETFRGEFEGALNFIDGNKDNPSLENLITNEELLSFYRKNRKK